MGHQEQTEWQQQQQQQQMHHQRQLMSQPLPTLACTLSAVPTAASCSILDSPWCPTSPVPHSAALVAAADSKTAATAATEVVPASGGVRRAHPESAPASNQRCNAAATQASATDVIAAAQKQQLQGQCQYNAAATHPRYPAAADGIVKKTKRASSCKRGCEARKRKVALARLATTAAAAAEATTGGSEQ